MTQESAGGRGRAAQGAPVRSAAASARARPATRGQRPRTRPARPGPALAVFAVLTTILLFLVVVLGFVDTFTHSALGCGRSFPLCDGRLLPPDNLRAVIEWGHRVVSAAGGLLVGILAIWTWARVGRVLEASVLAAISLGFVVIEAGVGALAVLVPESQGVIATHLGIALTSFAATAILTRVLWALRATGDGRLRRPRAPRGLVRWTVGALVFMYAAVYLGAYVAGTNSGAACLSLVCRPDGLDLSQPVTIDLLHRLAALVAVAWAAFLLALARRTRAARPELARLAHWMLVLVLAQVASGLALLATRLALAATLVHVGLATLLFTAVATMTFEMLPETRAPREPSGTARAATPPP